MEEVFKEYWIAILQSSFDSNSLDYLANKLRLTVKSLQQTDNSPNSPENAKPATEKSSVLENLSLNLDKAAYIANELSEIVRPKHIRSIIEREMKFPEVARQLKSAEHFYPISKGLVLIYNDTRDRQGAFEDEIKLHTLFDKLRRSDQTALYDVRDFDPLESVPTSDSGSSREPYSVVYVFIMCHGLDNDMFVVENKKFSHESIVKRFSTDLSWIDKPKAFFFLMCRKSRETDKQRNLSIVVMENVKFDDVIMVWSCQKGCFSFREINMGVSYITAFVKAVDWCRENQRWVGQYSLLDVLTMVNKKTLKEYSIIQEDSSNPEDSNKRKVSIAQEEASTPEFKSCLKKSLLFWI